MTGYRLALLRRRWRDGRAGTSRLPLMSIAIVLVVQERDTLGNFGVKYQLVLRYVSDALPSSRKGRVRITQLWDRMTRARARSRWRRRGCAYRVSTSNKTPNLAAVRLSRLLNE
jgi:hypothetical protein